MRHAVAFLLATALAVACAPVPILSSTSTTSVYPCGDPTQQWCDQKHRTCCDADDQICCTGAQCPAGMCETVSSGPVDRWAKKKPKLRPQTIAP